MSDVLLFPRHTSLHNSDSLPFAHKLSPLVAAHMPKMTATCLKRGPPPVIMLKLPDSNKESEGKET